MDFGEDREEAAHFGDVALSFTEYYHSTNNEITRRENAFKMLGMDRLRVSNISSRFPILRECAKQNQLLFDRIVQPFTQNVRDRLKVLQKERRGATLFSSFSNASKIRSTLHQIVREWSEEGAAERNQCFQPILEQLMIHVKLGGKVALPGCGLGRLVAEVASKGYEAQGSEFSYQMLLTGDFIMNQLNQKDEVSIYPWIDQPSNTREFSDHIRKVLFPDIPCFELVKDIPKNYLSICAGEFVHIYSTEENKGKWDAVIFCFFLDTAPSLCDYFRLIRNMLKPGGVLIHFGPLQWHFQPEHGGPQKGENDIRFFQSFEWTYADVKILLQSFGFKIVYEKQFSNCSYAANRFSMLKNLYDCELFVAVVSE